MANGSTAIDERAGSAGAAGAWPGAFPASGARGPDGVDPDRPGDVLQRLLAAIDKRPLHPVAHLPPSVLRDINPARLGDALDPRRDVDAVAHQIAVGLLDDVSEMNADAVLDALVRRDAGIALNHTVLNLDRAAQRIDHAAELDDQPIAGALDHPAVVGGDRRVGEVAAQSAQACEHALLVRPGETAEADDVGGKDGGELAGFFHGALGTRGR